MKNSLSLFCLTCLSHLSVVAIAIFFANTAEAQLSHSFGDQCCEPSGFQSVSGDLFGGPGAAGYAGNVYQPVEAGPGAIGPGGRFGHGLQRLGARRSQNSRSGAGAPGRMWLETNITDRGLGYQGTYLTLGGKNRIFEDRLDGRWLVEGEIHHSIEDGGGMFTNIGLERVFSVDAANADVSISAWYDYDGDADGTFAHDFHQVGLNAQIKTRKWDLIGNGYFPVGIQEYSIGDPTGANPFTGNSIVLIPGVDSALEGFDVTWRVRPSRLAMINGSIDLGGYQYSSELVNAFGGGRVRFGFQALGGMMVNAEINHDERFDTTGKLSVGWLFGANASGRGHEYSRLGRDLESVSRNDHIVRYNKDVKLAFDPLTGAAYNVVHVDNNADPSVEDGTAERPYADLQDAQDLSAPGDVIAIAAGDGTDRNMDGGIHLQDNQRLFGTGTAYVIPVQDGQFFQLGAGSDGTAPKISNGGGFAVVKLANNNEVAGLNVDGTGARFGIWGNGNNGSIHDNLIEDAVEDGIRIATPTGDWKFNTNTVQNNGRDGIFIHNATDNTSTFEFDSNIINGNSFDGIHLFNYDPLAISFTKNTTSNNLRHGLFLQNYLNTLGNPLVISEHIADANVGAGIYIDGGDGNLRILDSTVTNNLASGLAIRNWTSNNIADNIQVGTTEDGTSTFSGNGPLGNLEFVLDIAGARSNILVTDLTIDNGVRGVMGRVDGVGAIMNIDILDNLSINGNTSDGIRLLSLDGATTNARIGSTDPAVLQQIFDNAGGGGAAIQLVARGPNGQQPSRMNAVIENVQIDNRFSRFTDGAGTVTITSTTGIDIVSLNNGLVDVDVKNATIGGPDANIGDVPDRETQIGINISLDNDGSNLINKVALSKITGFNNRGVILTAGTETYTDFTLTDSVLKPNQEQSTPGTRSDNNPFPIASTLLEGYNGVLIRATGRGQFSGNINNTFNDHFGDQSGSGLRFAEVISDGVLDNFTRIHLEDNIIQDFAFNGVDISTTGDAQMQLTMKGNRIQNNGAGFHDDADGDYTYDLTILNENPTELLFYDGVNIDAFDQSTISTRIAGNIFVDNFERGLSLNTFSSATINAEVVGNAFFGNDRGEDLTNDVPDIGTGVFADDDDLDDSARFDFEAINNEEFYIRPHESRILLDPDGGAPIDLAGVDIPADTLGIFFPLNTGLNIFGQPRALGVATINLTLANNSTQTIFGADVRDFSRAPGEFRLGLDTASNGPVSIGGISPVQTVGTGFADAQIQAEEGAFAAQGFVQPTH